MIICKGRGKNLLPNSRYYAARAKREGGVWVDLLAFPRYSQAGPLTYVAPAHFSAFTLSYP
jgi:hypothetical protein